MKTKANNSEIRKRNKQTMSKRIMALVISFVLVSISTNAQDNYSLFSFDGYEMMAMAESNDSFTISVSSNDLNNMSIYLEPAFEGSLELEEWMINTNYFSTSSYLLEVEQENTLELQEWMLDELIFTVPQKIETEEELKLENWMLDEKIWI